MTRKKEEENGDSAHRKPFSKPHSGNIDDSIHSDDPADESTTHTNSHDKHTIIVNIPQQQVDGTDTKNISKWGVIVNAGLLVCTMILAGISMWQGCLTRRSVSIADSVFKAETLYNSKTLSNQKIIAKKIDSTDSVKTKRDTLFINKQKEGIDSQISAIKETQKQFEISHSPYIRIEDYKTSQPKTLIVTIENQGTALAWILEDEVKVKADIGHTPQRSADESRDWLPISKNPYNLQTLIAPGRKFAFGVPLDSISNSDMDEVNKGIKFLYIRCVIYYFNTTNAKVMTMEDISEYNVKFSATATTWFGYKKLKAYP